MNGWFEYLHEYFKKWTEIFKRDICKRTFFSKMFEAKSFFDKAALLPLFKSMTSLSIILG